MVTILGGPKGTGKTQRLIDMANADVEEAKGALVFIDHKDKYSRSVSTKIRFIDTKNFSLDDPKTFLGFICGLIAGNYDITTVYIDNLNRIISDDNLDLIKELLKDLENYTKDYDVELIVTMNISNEAEGEIFKEFNKVV